MNKSMESLSKDKGKNQLFQKKIQVHSPYFITYTTDLFTIDVLGGVDLTQVERMICTLRVSYQNYPPMRSTIDLYSDSQTDKLIRTICQKWELMLVDVSKSIHGCISDLENYKLERLKYPTSNEVTTFEMSEDEEKEALRYLKDKNLTQSLKSDFSSLGILGEDNNALTLFIAMASHKYENPFSVLCLAKSGVGKSDMLQKLASCVPSEVSSYHTKMSEKALYYSDSYQLDGKVLFIEDLEWTHEMLNPLATLQTQGKLTSTRPTKNRDGMIHSTTFEVDAKLCLIACAYAEKNLERLSLPFLCLHLNQSQDQDQLMMDYQRRVSAGLIDKNIFHETAHRLKCVIASLEAIRVINPYALLIDLPDDIPHPRTTLQLLLHFIEVVTFFHQHQRTQKVDETTGEIFIESTPEDVKLAFELLKNSLLHKADELTTSARCFLTWLQHYLSEAKCGEFTALDIRKAKTIHPRTLNRHLQELTLFNYLQITGGNKHRGGFVYKLTDLTDGSTIGNTVEASMQTTLNAIQQESSRSVSQNSVSNSQTLTSKGKDSRTTPTRKKQQPVNH